MIYYRSVFFFGNKSDWCGCLMLLVNVYKFTPSPVVESSYYFKTGTVLGGGGGGGTSLSEPNGDVPLDGVTFSIELLEWGRTFLDFWGKKVFDIYS